MKTGEKGITLIKHYESFSPVIYLCPAGKPTIGYGHVVLPREHFDEPITEEFACEILAKDLAEAESDVEHLITVDLSNNQFDALVSFTFNLGGPALAGSTLRRDLNHYDYDDAADEFLKWVYARVDGVLTKLNGLIARRKSEKELFLTADEVEDGSNT